MIPLFFDDRLKILLLLIFTSVAVSAVQTKRFESGVIDLLQGLEKSSSGKSYTQLLKTAFSQDYSAIAGIVSLQELASAFLQKKFLSLNITKKSPSSMQFYFSFGRIMSYRYSYLCFAQSIPFIMIANLNGNVLGLCNTTNVTNQRQCLKIVNVSLWNQNQTRIIPILDSFTIAWKYFYQIKNPTYSNHTIVMRVRGDYGVFVININFLMYHCTRENQNKYYFTQNKLTSSTLNRSVPIFSSNHHILAGLSAVHLGGVNLTRWSYFYDISQGVFSAINATVSINYFTFIDIVCPDSSEYDNIKGICIKNDYSKIIVTSNIKINKPNNLQIVFIFSGPVIFPDTVKNSICININSKQLPFEVMVQAKDRLIVEVQISESSGTVLSKILNGKIWDTKEKHLQQQEINASFKDVYINSESEKRVIGAVASASSFAAQIVSPQSILIASAFGLMFLFVNLIDVIQIVTLYIFLQVRLPPNLNLVLYQLFSKQTQTLYAGYAQIFRNFRRLVFLSTESPVQMSVNFIQNNLEKIALLLLICFVFWIGAKLTQRRIDNCIGKIVQKVFVFKCYSNCVNSYISIQTRLAFTSAIVVRDLQKNLIPKLLLPFHIFGLTIFLFTTLLGPFLHAICLQNSANLKKVRTKDNYYGTVKGQPFSIGLVISRVILGPVIAVSIVLLPPSLALLIGTLICFLNVGFELTATFTVRIAQCFSAASAISYLMFHLSTCLFALKLLSGRTQWMCGYISIGFLAMIILMRFCELCATIVSGFFQRKSNATCPAEIKSPAENLKKPTNHFKQEKKQKISQTSEFQKFLDIHNKTKSRVISINQVKKVRQMQREKWLTGVNKKQNAQRNQINSIHLNNYNA